MYFYSSCTWIVPVLGEFLYLNSSCTWIVPVLGGFLYLESSCHVVFGRAVTLFSFRSSSHGRSNGGVVTTFEAGDQPVSNILKTIIKVFFDADMEQVGLCYLLSVQPTNTVFQTFLRPTV